MLQQHCHARQGTGEDVLLRPLLQKTQPEARRYELPVVVLARVRYVVDPELAGELGKRSLALFVIYMVL